MGLSLRPFAFSNSLQVKRNSWLRGSGPLALPPKVFSTAPAFRTLVKSQVGISPAYRRLINSLNALAHPSLLSRTSMQVSVGCSSLGTKGN